jgi:FkbH-like protein
MIDNKVKLVVWDLDETFWRGTLTEEGIAPVQRNLDIVAELPKRGILNSICSKNDHDQTKAKLVELGVWDWFVFPAISFNPKGKAVAEMIEGAALRAENVLFIDDNKLNLEEVKFFNPGIMTAHPDEVLEGLLDHPNLAGKPDPELTRLNQYKFLQRKVEERSSSALSNDEFLRTSNIRVTIDYEVEKNFNRIVELINRANQLNYTKVRLNTDEEVEQFRKWVTGFGFHAGCVRAVDNYGDYGLIGFFLVKQRAKGKRLVHFVFSCRTMNMGIEQFVYESLEQPEIEVVGPVSYGLETHERIDWINTGGEDADSGAKASDSKLVLIGGCHLLQLASYCSNNRSEFVNIMRNGAAVRFDDPGFILSDRKALKESEALRLVPSWQYEDAIAFDEAIASAEVVLTAMWAGMNAPYLGIGDDITFCLKRPRMWALRNSDPKWYQANIRELANPVEGKLDATLRSFDAIDRMSSPTCRIFVMGCFTKGDPEDYVPKRKYIFNDACRAYCAAHSRKFRYIDLDGVMPIEELVSREHFSRAGYFHLARHILSEMASPEEMLRAAS